MPRNKKYWKRRLGQVWPEGASPYQHHLDLRRINDLEDEGLACILAGIKGIDMLDLNETEITNKSIPLLAKLECLKELNLKDVPAIDNNCIDDLNKINGLEFLHIRFTGITFEGVMKLKLPHLKKLIFSVENPDDLQPNTLQNKMEQLKKLPPNCEFFVNSVPYELKTIMPNTPGSALNTPAN